MAFSGPDEALTGSAAALADSRQITVIFR